MPSRTYTTPTSPSSWELPRQKLSAVWRFVECMAFSAGMGCGAQLITSPHCY